jgi:hypothetical protein
MRNYRIGQSKQRRDGAPQSLSRGTMPNVPMIRWGASPYLDPGGEGHPLRKLRDSLHIVGPRDGLCGSEKIARLAPLIPGPLDSGPATGT